MREWMEIDDFPGYSVSDDGQVRNDSFGRAMSLSRNQQGQIKVGLVQNGEQHSRSVGVLVAAAFLDPPFPHHFNTVIHLDGDLSNNHADNLMWRPRWFAIKYHQQFHNGKRGYIVPVRDVDTGERFRTSWDAALKYGLLDREIMIATENRTYVFPTSQRFEVIEE